MEQALSKPPLVARPTIWGLEPTQLHDHFWAARGVHVVRQGEPSEIVEGADLFLLTDPRTLAIFRLRAIVENLSWLKPDILFIRLKSNRERGYQESILTDEAGQFVQFKRNYGGADTRLARVALTPHQDVARLFQTSPDPRTAWCRIRQHIHRSQRDVTSIKGRAYDRFADAEVATFVRDLIDFWPYPSSTIRGIREVAPCVWAYDGVQADSATRFIGPAWIGAGRSLTAAPTVLGPAALWDDPKARPKIEEVRWQELEPMPTLPSVVQPKNLTSLQQALKRLFDVAFALVAILLTLPLYPFVMLAIYLEDGRPFFFGHRRETLAGREFPCWKFRSMRKDADQIKTQLAKQNQADGPQFFMENDPRLTRVGRVIRKLNIDELPQFFNVLLGHMSIVGPRPSPRKENQFCPQWREARLSVRPGITGLWQVSRTRRLGQDFQEWIKYDIEYVENASWYLDLKIILKTFGTILRGIIRS